MKIGENITKYRKNVGLTQEALGEAVGVSGQAVSKWENGGLPDTYLLPEISKVLGVSIDTLFGSDKNEESFTKKEISSLLYEYIRKNVKKEDFFGFFFEIIWNMQCGYLGVDERPTYNEAVKKYENMTQITSQILDDFGTTYLSFVKGLPFFCAVKDCMGLSDRILSEDKYSELFSLLADSDSRKAVFFTQGIEKSSQYTASAISERLGISQEKLEGILPLLVKYYLLSEENVAIDGKEVKVYKKFANPEIRALFVMAYQFVNAKMCYYNFTSNRTKPYFDVK